MRLAAFTDYGLQVLMRLARTPREVSTTIRIAEEFGIPYNHLTKVVQDLARGDFVTTQRGAGGGIRLARPADSITLGDVVRFLEQRYAIVECFRADGGACPLRPSCRLRSRLAAAHEAFLAELDRSTVADCAYVGPLPNTPAAATAAGKRAAAPPRGAASRPRPASRDIRSRRRKSPAG